MIKKSLKYNLESTIQDVHKVSLQFKKITTTSNDKITQKGLFYVNQYFTKFSLTLKFIVSDKFFMRFRLIF